PVTRWIAVCTSRSQFDPGNTMTEARSMQWCAFLQNERTFDDGKPNIGTRNRSHPATGLRAPPTAKALAFSGLPRRGKRRSTLCRWLSYWPLALRIELDLR